ncbi:hypothetical protein [Piscirickettsia salmonis]|uniref:hypothetical protein n=1 Tax=Piscirickettsia salmonis TaxID=1238 RepID=UPI0005632032|nr:hypothetical protein [Piscirickettsia salmonis]ALT18597.1 hypothetical protein PSLF89_07060 [Piscirickettsia salmonis LF-89 = ATCC VR-1361]ALY03369.1 hypothetical protein AWE47_11375 [Piscirickettsia salmonis]AMA42935.1 hypothetical protein AWJ11_11605 [Piscirickettsia salmonis]AOS35403.1 hypothetical protein AVM72_08730 [Piscirickettsia salmonis]APS60108.1 hypothetical protein AVI53_05660 [Piscirickettsia salmonis]
MLSPFYCFFRTKFRLYLAAKSLVFQILLMSNSRYKTSDVRLEHERDQLFKKVGELSLEVDYLKKGFASI